MYNFDYIQSFQSSVVFIVIPPWTCNDTDYTLFDFSRFTAVESIKIGHHCFRSVQTFKIDGLNRLKSLIIENDSFFQLDKFYWREILQNDATETNYQLKSFHILNCESLESIQIGEYCFCDFGGDFELKNLPQLQSIQIGEIEKISGNFYHSSLVIRGIDVILSNEYAIDLPNLQSITLGDTAFNASLHTVIESIN